MQIWLHILQKEVHAAKQTISQEDFVYSYIVVFQDSVV